MKTKMLFPIFAMIAGLGAGTARGQTASPAPAPAPAFVPAADQLDDVIELSPFEVSASQDVGYQARETLAGGRVRTSLDDIANSIDVITAQLIEDMGALDLQDIVAYGNNIEAGSLMGDGNENGALTGLWDQNTTYFRGFRTYRGTRNFMFTLMSFNAFSSDRIDLSKGPNAVLFGIGEPGGAINYNTKRASLNRDRTEVSLRTDSEGSIRAQLDVDQALIKNKLGLRTVLLAERTKFPWNPAYSDTDGLFLAATYKPFGKTTIRANYEYRNANRVLGRRVYPRDSFTPYLNAGAPKIIAPMTNNNTVSIEGSATPVPRTSIGVARNTSARFFSLEDGTVINRLNTASTSSLGVGAENDVQVRHGGYPNATIIGGRNAISDSQDKMVEVTLEQELAKNLYLELGFANWTMQRLQANGALSNVHNLQIDPNGFMPGSTTVANPNFGRYYSEMQPWLYDRHEEVKTYRATLSYAIDLTRRSRWLGNHRMSVMWENYKFRELWDRKHLMITGTPTGTLPNANPTNATNNVWVRDYYDFDTGDSYMHDITSWYYQDNVDIGSGYTANWLRSTAGLRANLTDTTTKLAVWQGAWFKNRLILTWGYRGLKQKNYNANGSGYIVRDATTRELVWRDPVSGETRTSIFDASIPPDPRSVDTGVARNEGIVIKALPWLSLTANHATNFNPTAGLADITGRILGAAQGETTDYGIRLKLMDGKVSFSALHYQTDATELSTGGGGRSSPYANINSMYNILVENGVLAENPFETTDASNRVVFNQKASGYEFTLFARPVAGLSIRLNAATTENIASDVGIEVIDYYQNVARPLLSNPAYADLSSGGQTVGTLLNSADDNLQQMQNYSGRINPPSSKWTANMNVSYSFDRASAFNGFTVGGGVRWRGKPLMGYWTNDDGTLDLSKAFYATDNYNFDFFTRYRRKLTNKITWSVQFNIRNLANDQGYSGVRAINVTTAPDSPVVVTRYALKEPRLFILSNTFSF